MRRKIFVGILHPRSYYGKGHHREIFTTNGYMPTFHTHGIRYTAVIGPFRSRLAAEIMAKHGENNPHFQHVEDAESFARLGRTVLRGRGFDV